MNPSSSKPSLVIARLRADLSMLDVARDYGVSLRRSGANWVGRCPNPTHEDRNPSFVVSLKDGVWLFHCFGCRRGGSNIDLVMWLEGLEFRAALHTLRDRYFPDRPRSEVRK